jgi:hypothetical protein
VRRKNGVTVAAAFAILPNGESAANKQVDDSQGKGGGNDLDYGKTGGSQQHTHRGAVKAAESVGDRVNCIPNRL